LHLPDNRFFKIDDLLKDGYLDPTTDTVTLVFHVRASSFYQHSIDQGRYINRLCGEARAVQSTTADSEGGPMSEHTGSRSMRLSQSLSLLVDEAPPAAAARTPLLPPPPPHADTAALDEEVPERAGQFALPSAPKSCYRPLDPEEPQPGSSAEEVAGSPIQQALLQRNTPNAAAEDEEVVAHNDAQS
jgi:hypothetical protein